jgi:hypothetical protein
MKDVLILAGRGYSGRAVRVKHLGPSKTDQVALDAAKIASASAVDFRLTQLRLGVSRMLVAITREPVPFIDQPVIDAHGKPVLDEHKQPRTEAVVDDEWLAKAEHWEAIDAFKIETPGGYDHYISSAKDDSWLTGYYLAMHEVAPGDVDRIMGKARTVSSG